MDSNVSLQPEGPGDEVLPLVPLNRSPPLDRRQRAMALSQLSLQSMASNHYDATDTADDDETVSMATVLDWNDLIGMTRSSKTYDNIPKNSKIFQ